MEGEWLTAMQILSYLQTKTRDKLAISKVGQFGRALQKLNIPCRKSRKGTLYHLVKVEQFTLTLVTPMNKGFYKNRNFRVVYQIYVW